MIKQKVIDELYDLNIYDVVSKHVELKKAGSNYKGSCPFHTEKTPSFMVSPAKGIYKCYGCGAGGNNGIKFLMQLRSLEWKDAVTDLAKEHNITMEYEDDDPDKQKQRESLQRKKEQFYVMYGYAADVFQENLKHDKKALDYARSRFTDEEIEKWRIGWADGKFLRKATDNGYLEEALIDAGLVKESEGRSYDFFINRLVFPGFDKAGRVVAFSGRVIEKSKYGKYKNSENSIIFDKSSFLYGMHLLHEHDRKNVYVVEGNPDTIAMHSVGLFAVSAWGTSISEQQMKVLRKFEKIYLVYDGDSAGQKALERNGELFVKQGLSPQIVVLPDGQDPYDFCKSNSK